MPRLSLCPVAHPADVTATMRARRRKDGPRTWYPPCNANGLRPPPRCIGGNHAHETRTLALRWRACAALLAHHRPARRGGRDRADSANRSDSGEGRPINGMPANGQTWNLSCEYAATSAATAYYGQTIAQYNFATDIGFDANPNIGFRGSLLTGAMGRHDRLRHLPRADPQRPHRAWLRATRTASAPTPICSAPPSARITRSSSGWTSHPTMRRAIRVRRTAKRTCSSPTSTR